MKKYILSIVFLSFLMPSFMGWAQDSRKARYEKAVSLYRQGIYAEAMSCFGELSLEQPDMMCAGYECLCALKMRSESREVKTYSYLFEYPFSPLASQIVFEYGRILFDDGDYESARDWFGEIHYADLVGDDSSECLFKSAYCDYVLGDNDKARGGFEKIAASSTSPYAPAACYSLGYICYNDRNFEEAAGWYDRSSKSEEYRAMSEYYIIDCDFMMKKYDKVIADGTAKLDSFSPECAAHVRRLVAESYLVKGEAAKAREIYVVDDSPKSRSDLFFEGSLMYAVRDWKGAIANYSAMENRTDSIGQVANYNLGYSYIQTKNKVAALRSFKDASESDIDPEIAEDALFNYAKLAFDLNNDGSVFQRYITKYPSKKSSDSIYGYMAVAALRSKDYAAAVEAFDKIDDLDPDMRDNYMKTNYLRASQLVSDGSYRAAIPCLKSAAYYADKGSGFYKLSRFWLAESYFRSGDYPSARVVFTDLWNNSAFEGTPQYAYVPFSMGYCYFKEGAYKQAVKWFDTYLETGEQGWRQSALVRKSDCYFIEKNYKDALSGYEKAYDEEKNPNEVYAYYQAGLCYGLLGNDQKKILALQPVRQASPDARFYSEALYELGRAYVAVKRSDAAAECFNKLLDGAKDTTYMVRSLIELGMIARNRTHNGEAMDYYKSVIALMPVSTYAEDALAALESIYQSNADPQGYLEYLAEIGMTNYKTDEEKEQMLFNAAEQVYASGDWQKAIASLEAFMRHYPSGKMVPRACFYMADSYRMLGQKEQACDFYRKVMASEDDAYLELATLNYAALSYSLQDYGTAYDAYESLMANARIPQNKTVARQGMMCSAYSGRMFAKAIAAASDVIAQADADKTLVEEAQWIKAKSYLAESHREEALPLLESLSKNADTPRGAEARYLIIKDAYDSGEFDKARDLVFTFSDAGTDQSYWLAKSFIILGDCYVEKGDKKQAIATYKSVLDGYEAPDGKDDDVIETVKERMSKLENNK